MPISLFGAVTPAAPVGEFGVVSLQIEGQEFGTVKEFSFHQHFLTPTDKVQLTVASDLNPKDVRERLIAGSKIQILIDTAVQFSGYLDAFDFSIDRSSGTIIHIEGRDTMSAVVDSQIDPDHHYPDKTPLETLLRELLEPFGFVNFEITNEDNVDVAAGRAAKQKKGVASPKHRRSHKKTSGKALKQYPLPKSKPEHNDSFYQFISRILNRLGLWMWPGVDGETIIVGKPNYDQDAIGQLRRVVGGLNNNIERGGIRVDTTEQPSFIVARGNIPPTEREHSKMQIVIDNPLGDAPTPTFGEQFRNSGGTREQVQAALLGQAPDFSQPKPAPSLATQAFKFSRSQGGLPDAEGGGFGALRDETGSYSEAQAKASPIYEKLFKYTTKIKADPVKIPNPFASRVARPRFLHDRDSHTIEQLERFARRQMSLCVRKAFVAKYTFQGFYLDGAIPQPDTIVGVLDEQAGFDGNLWVLSRNISQSRTGGTRTELELVPLNSISF